MNTECAGNCLQAGETILLPTPRTLEDDAREGEMMVIIQTERQWLQDRVQVLISSLSESPDYETMTKRSKELIRICGWLKEIQEASQEEVRT